jgi:hypothetical protein
MYTPTHLFFALTTNISFVRQHGQERVYKPSSVHLLVPNTVSCRSLHDMDAKAALFTVVVLKCNSLLRSNIHVRDRIMYNVADEAKLLGV